MKVKMKTTVSGTESFYRAGDTYDITEAHARRLVAVDYAEYADPADAKQSAESASAETAKKEKR